MKVDEIFGAVKESMTARRVYAEPVERDGQTVIAAASVAGGGGGGEGTDETGKQGTGGGFAVRATPVGAYVLADGRVRWQPTVDVNRLFAAIAAVAIVALITSAFNRGRLHR